MADSSMAEDNNTNIHSHGQPLQIVTIKDSTTDSEDPGDSFNLIEENLTKVFDKVPPGVKVSIVSVVGAFRTGKSFLLNFFLRYLRHGSKHDLSESWMMKDGEALTEGNMNEGRDTNQDIASASFQWRGGQQRQTTGIWIWSEPFIKTDKNGDKVAVILMDTQGMFDSDTSMALTAQIFGLSTFVSSYQIYNVDKRLQEDNLQHLALFSEYGRLALKGDESTLVEEFNKNVTDTTTISSTSDKSPSPSSSKEQSPHGPPPVSESTRLTAIPEAQSTDNDEVTTEEDATGTKRVRRDTFIRTEATQSTEPVPHVSPHAADTRTSMRASTMFTPRTTSRYLRRTLCRNKPPFQRVQFLIRDWQNFSMEWDEDTSIEEKQSTYNSTLRVEMKTYLNGILHPRGIEDLQSTRDQILRCFESVDCFLLPHPGSKVTKRNFSGLISEIDPFFRSLVDKYVREVFETLLEPKLINDRPLGAPELFTYFQVYVKTFQKSNKSFPKAMTLLDATAEANNRNAYQLGMDKYKTMMGAAVADNKPYQKEVELLRLHQEVEVEIMNQFDDMAGLGAEQYIEQYRNKLAQDILEEWNRYKQVNWLRNPYREIERYILPVSVAGGFWVLATVFDLWCTSDQCEFIEDTFERIYIFVGFIILMMAYSQPYKDAHLYTVPLGIGALSWFVATIINSSCTTTSCVKAGDAFERVYMFVAFGLTVLLYKNFATVMKFAKETVVPMLNANTAAATETK